MDRLFSFFFLLVVFFWISKVASVFCFFPFGVSAAYSFISMSTTYYLPMYPPNKPRKFLTLFITSLDVKNTACDSGARRGKGNAIRKFTLLIPLRRRHCPNLFTFYAHLLIVSTHSPISQVLYGTLLGTSFTTYSAWGFM